MNTATSPKNSWGIQLFPSSPYAFANTSNSVSTLAFASFISSICDRAPCTNFFRTGPNLSCGDMGVVVFAKRSTVKNVNIVELTNWFRAETVTLAAGGTLLHSCSHNSGQAFFLSFPFFFLSAVPSSSSPSTSSSLCVDYIAHCTMSS